MSTSVTRIQHDKVLEIILNRPPVNAIDLRTSTDLYEAFKDFQENPRLRVAVLTAAGERLFSAGWDLKEYAANGDDLLASGDYDLGPGGLGGLSEFWGLSKPVIAAVNGKAIGGGFEMLLAADLIIAAEHAQFMLPETRLGFLPDAGGLQRLAKRLPYNLAAELMLTGRAMGADEAQRWGLVCQVVPAAELRERSLALAQHIAEGAPLAQQAMKEVLAQTHALNVEAAFACTRRAWQGNSSLPAYEKMLHSDDYLEGSRAFTEKRKPVYKGC
ncbi:enoyl-CoA hydratase/isomerase family protein [Pseudomonas lalucatii]|uniref:Enoyl-CoA hydratase/isomerase family protein n=1 Tax=Pseudomonas lalucatii TaxID=1424203 RepID=A0ABS5PZN3_9PSED|nr:enoyl-CoA hydratase-related protein [Pseudomonas lalucatii]MBS7661693.1 enoyl-CoA hydratase/isomerase family protein [Pseudomonas lalucatii]MBS7723904.1 enoyl-CoA hydratase/isomerase family protein [Pseudomonas lalucatii]QVM88092.1 enoyl-CoA hydratase/isomerase family protein [Pseudomonas lalucatii]